MVSEVEICYECGWSTVDLPVEIQITYKDGSVKSTNSEEQPLCLSCLAEELHGTYQAHKKGHR